MMTTPLPTTLAAMWLAVAALTGIAGRADAAVSEWSAESRVVLAFHANEQAIQALLPEGWEVAPATAAASRGANLNVTLIDRAIVLDADGKPVGSGISRYVVLGVPARHRATGNSATMIVGGISPEGAGAYGVYVTAATTHLSRSSDADGLEPGQAREEWAFTAASGERIELRLAYRRALPVKSHVDAVIHSALRPAFSRTYRIDQASDLLRSGPAAVDRVDALTFQATGPRFAALFDGGETLLSVTAVPWYVREISVN